MSDEKQSLEEKLKSFSSYQGTPFFTFAKPYLDFIGKGTLFSIIYTIMAVVNLLLPFVIIYKVIDSGFFRSIPARFVIAFIFSLFVIAFACWIGFQLWWDRKSKVKTFEGSEFIVTPMVSELLQTFGEWLGTLIGIIGAGVGLITAIILGEEAEYLFDAIGIDFIPSGFIAVIAGPVIGFLVVILFRFVAEQLRILVALANNTKSIANNIKG
jgi:hypothetical protein